MQNRPQQRPLLTAQWANVVVVNYTIDPQVIQPLVPHETVLDDFEGHYFVSLVGFLFKDTKCLGVLPIYPFHTFEEINLRFYIKRRAGEMRRGVCFVKEIVPHRTIAWIARALYNENYVAHPTTHRWEWNDPRDPDQGGTFLYRWHGDTSVGTVAARTAGPLTTLTNGSLASFILEHYWGYVTQKEGGTKEYQVWHPPWQYWSVAATRVQIDIHQLYGERFVLALSQTPHSAFVAQGSTVAVYRGRDIF